MKRPTASARNIEIDLFQEETLFLQTDRHLPLGSSKIVLNET